MDNDCVTTLVVTSMDDIDEAIDFEVLIEICAKKEIMANNVSTTKRILHLLVSIVIVEVADNVVISSRIAIYFVKLSQNMWN